MHAGLLNQQIRNSNLNVNISNEMKFEYYKSQQTSPVNQIKVEFP